MKLSLVIPVYNEEAYIGACLESVMRQTEKPDEIIVVDNNSIDRTVEIVSRYPVRILQEEQQGMIPARNAGFNAAQYDIIARCDADDVLPGDWVARIKRNFTELNIDALCGPLIYSDLPMKTAIIPNLYLDTMKVLQFGNETMVGPNMALTKRMWEKVRNRVCLDDTRVHEDIDLGMKIIQAGGTIYRDRQLIVRSSARRMKKRPLSFFVEYPWRFVKTFVNHLFHK
ncbi:MAG: glycosyltransferase family 2 protein [Candidatus Peribacteraceae bacterium]|nr:glycosyltransferase family 2 protein [Candidatus Peribacteraceae bacterium]